MLRDQCATFARSHSRGQAKNMEAVIDAMSGLAFGHDGQAVVYDVPVQGHRLMQGLDRLFAGQWLMKRHAEEPTRQSVVFRRWDGPAAKWDPQASDGACLQVSVPMLRQMKELASTWERAELSFARRGWVDMEGYTSRWREQMRPLHDLIRAAVHAYLPLPVEEREDYVQERTVDGMVWAYRLHVPMTEILTRRVLRVAMGVSGPWLTDLLGIGQGEVAGSARITGTDGGLLLALCHGMSRVIGRGDILAMDAAYRMLDDAIYALASAGLETAEDGASLLGMLSVGWPYRPQLVAAIEKCMGTMQVRDLKNEDLPPPDRLGAEMQMRALLRDAIASTTDEADFIVPGESADRLIEAVMARIHDPSTGCAFVTAAGLGVDDLMPVEE